MEPLNNNTPVITAQNVDKRKVDALINAMVEAVENGEVDALKTYIQIKAIAEASGAALKRINGHAVDEAAKYGEKTFKAFGAEVSRKSAAGRYSYDHIDHIKNGELTLKEYKEEAKDAYKQAQKGKQVIDDEGEIVQPAHYSGGAETIAINFKKGE